MISGIISSVFAGVLNGSFAAPMKKIVGWKWENTWFVYALMAMFILPITTAFVSVPRLFEVYAQADNSVLLKTILTGFLFGVGSVTFGLGLQLAGLSLGNSLMVGIISVTGSLVPMLILSPEAIFTVAGGLLLLAMVISVIGVIYCSIAGNIRAKSLDNATQSGEKRVPFKIALIVCLVSGFFSAMLNVSLVLGLPVAELAKENLPGAFGTYRAYNAVWALTLSGAFLPYLFGCVFLLIRNKSIVRYKKAPSGFMPALLMGVLWFSCISLYGAGASQLGKLGTTIGWLILMAVTVIVGNLWGFMTGEWEHAPTEARQKMTKGLLFMFLSVVVVGVAKYLS